MIGAAEILAGFAGTAVQVLAAALVSLPVLSNRQHTLRRVAWWSCVLAGVSLWIASGPIAGAVRAALR